MAAGVSGAGDSEAEARWQGWPARVGAGAEETAVEVARATAEAAGSQALG